MHRLFVAIRPSPAIRNRLIGLMTGVAGARWQSDEQLHLTLRFIGEVERPQAEDIATSLGSVDGPRPSFGIRGVGVFGRPRPHTLWAGVIGDAALVQLQQRIERALVRAGVLPERRAFMPHVTVARLDARAGPVEPWLAEAAAVHAPSETYDAFGLYESRLGAEGASYTLIARYPLVTR